MSHFLNRYPFSKMWTNITPFKCINFYYFLLVRHLVVSEWFNDSGTCRWHFSCCNLIKQLTITPGVTFPREPVNPNGSWLQKLVNAYDSFVSSIYPHQDTPGTCPSKDFAKQVKFHNVVKTTNRGSFCFQIRSKLL